MCGISGLANLGNGDVLHRMTQVQAHRGPDDAGVWEHRSPDGTFIGLGSRRLAILDLSALGHMPMANEDRTLWITYNGEVYNFAEIRRQLAAQGHQFRSQTDTEVVLRLYQHEGPECVKRLKGMFVFAVCDLRSDSPVLFLARDHFGVKPLYYAQRHGGLAFASEVKALLEVPEIHPEMDLQALQQYLTFLWVPDPATMFRGIFKLPAGHYAIWKDGNFQMTQYWDLHFPSATHHFPRSEADLAEETRERFLQSVRAQMVSDVPVAAFLSAGLDSTSIVAGMVRASSHPVSTYTVTFPQKYRVGETTLDDPDVAARAARRLGCTHHNLVVEPDVAALLPKLLWHMDEPVADPAIIAAYLVCREARQDATVLLSGVGGDELFAGYRKHAADLWARKYRYLPSLLRRGLLDPSMQRLPNLRGSALKGRLRLARKMARSASLPPRERFLMNCTYLDADQREQICLPGVFGDADPAARHRDYFSRVEDADFLNQMLYLDTKAFMTSLNLTYNDKMSMASSVEVRVPFLDYEFAEFAATQIPPKWKLKGTLRPQTKHIFRRAMRDLLPEEVLRQPKAGFFAPIDYWLAHDLRPMVDDLLSEQQIRRRGLFQPAVVRAFIDQHRSGQHDWSMQIWQFLTLEIWMRLFLDGGHREFSDSALAAQPAATA
jgi:asparagine synthase (glutamine-hydrolysing)